MEVIVKKRSNFFLSKIKLSIDEVFLIIFIFVIFLGILFVQKSSAAEMISKSNILGRPGINISSLRHYSALSFDERVICQKAIEKVYYSHRTWSNPEAEPQFEEVIADNIIIEKVKDIIGKSNALEFYWQRPVTAEQLQAEIDRMAEHTKNPEMLKELFNALDNDPHLIAECIARPNLADRFIRSYYAYDEKFHGKIKEKARMDLHNKFSASQMKLMSGDYSEIEWVKATAISQTDKETDFALNQQEWNDLINDLRINQVEINQISGLIEETNRFFVQAILEKTAERIRIARVIWHKKEFDIWWEENKNNFSLALLEPSGYYSITTIAPTKDIADTWQPTFSCHKKRLQHTAIWTNAYNEMIIWGGSVDGQYSNEGERYNPATDTWTCMSVINAPSPRVGHTAIWVERNKNIIVMIIWGGRGASGAYENTGAWYNPVNDTWKTMKTDGTPSPRMNHTAIWTGVQMIIWGGEVQCDNPPWCDLTVTNSAASYDPAFEDNWFISAWQPISRSNYSAPRSGHTTVSTGADMIVWGGHGCMDPPLCEWQEDILVTGSKFNYNYYTWSSISTVNAPSARDGYTAVWATTTSEMIIFGGHFFNGDYHLCLGIGGKYDPATDQWTAISASQGRAYHSAIWTGSTMIIWGGQRSYPGNVCYDNINSGQIYDPSQDSWSSVPTDNAPIARKEHTAIWTGSEMIIWGGTDSGALNTGGRYNPQTQSWVPTNIGQPDGRSYHTAIWTGSEMIIWGGYYSFNYFNTGSRYYPAIDNWMATSLIFVPTARYLHSAIWSGTEMYIWGGQTGSYNYTNTGGKYNPFTNSWSTLPTANAPSARRLHKAVWSGNEMIIWGGLDTNNNYINSGSRYYGTWTPTSLTNAPIGRAYFEAVWSTTTNEMVVWGGQLGYHSYTNTGGKYDPVSDSWIATNSSNPPEARELFTAIWSGEEMIIWGGHNYDTSDHYLYTGGRYNPYTDSWSGVSEENAPTGRQRHSAIWTGTAGSEMIIWGGNDGAVPLNTGGRYSPVSNSWVSTSTEGAPSVRDNHTAVWTGTEMIIWGGGSYLNTGGKYIP